MASAPVAYTVDRSEQLIATVTGTGDGGVENGLRNRNARQQRWNARRAQCTAFLRSDRRGLRHITRGFLDSGC